LVVIDGERLNNARADPSATGAPVSVVEPSQLESIEVVGGAGSSLYGSDAIGGVINLITKTPLRNPDGSLLVGLRLDGNYGGNGKVGRGNATLTASNDIVAARANFSLYRHSNYKMGNGSVSLAQNLAFGNFFRQFPTNAAGTTFQAASSYPIFALSPNQEIVLGEGHGDSLQFDMWFFPFKNHSFRGKAINRSDGYNGNAFSGPPYETQERFGDYRDYIKTSLRYEALDIAKWIARFSSNFYYQKISFPQGQYTWVNLAGATGSYTATGAAGVFTGLPSIFVSGVSGATFTDNRNSIGSTGIDIQATLLPFRGMLLTLGGGRTRDNSRDYFFNTPFTAVGGIRNLGSGVGSTTIGSSSPVSNYIDNNFYVQGEFDRFKYFRLTGGIRFDNWKTEGLPGNGFPLSTEFAALNAAIPGLTASPGALTSLVAGLPSLVALAGGTASASSSNNSRTYNFGVVGRLPYGINPYFRWASSYREPAITERYLIRNFTPGLPGLASLVVGNLGLKPERGENYDVGVKVTQSRFNFSLGYFRNEITDLLAFAPAQTYCVAPLPGLPGGAAGGCASTPATNLGIQINARINFAAAEIKGWESTGEVSIPLGNFGSVNPFYTLGSLHGTNKSPSATQLRQLAVIYNRTDTPIRLEGSPEDFPLGSITPLRIIYGAQFLESKGRVFVEYDVRHQNRVTRADPGQFVGTALINYGSFASTNSFDKHAIKGGYNLRREKYKLTFNAGIDNISNKLYWEHFQNAPAPGRSFIFGITTEIFNFFAK
jgi:outer membrane receptor protein involved in Fe transport